RSRSTPMSRSASAPLGLRAGRERGSEQSPRRMLVSSVAQCALEDISMKRFTLIAATAVLAILAATNYASARLGIAPLAVSDDAVIHVRGHGHGHGNARGHR